MTWPICLVFKSEKFASRAFPTVGISTPPTAPCNSWVTRHLFVSVSRLCGSKPELAELSRRVCSSRSLTPPRSPNPSVRHPTQRGGGGRRRTAPPSLTIWSKSPLLGRTSAIFGRDPLCPRTLNSPHWPLAGERKPWINNRMPLLDCPAGKTSIALVCRYQR